MVSAKPSWPDGPSLQLLPSALSRQADIKPSSPNELSLKYKPEVSRGLSLYLGTGLAYSLTTNEMSGETKKDIKAGVAGSAGVHYLLNPHSNLYFDYKYFYLASDTRHINEGITPQVIGIGLDLKFW